MEVGGGVESFESNWHHESLKAVPLGWLWVNNTEEVTQVCSTSSFKTFDFKKENRQFGELFMKIE